MKLQITHVGNSKAYCVCPRHLDKRPSISIDLDGDYAGCFHCWSCGWSGKLSPETMAQLVTKRKKRNRLITLDWEKLNQEYHNTWEVHGPCVSFNKPFDVNWVVLRAFQCGWDGSAYTFPMRLPNGQISGIQRRWQDSTKCCVEGSQLSLFIPTTLLPQTKEIVDCGASQGPSQVRPLFITEGVSDACSIYNLGFPAIGRPSCQGQEEMIKEYLELNGIENVVIVADNDKPGLKGMDSLINSLINVMGPESRALIPVNKDIRIDIEKLGREEVVKRLKG